MNPDEKYPFLSHRTMAEVMAEEEAHSVRLAISTEQRRRMSDAEASDRLAAALRAAVPLTKSR